MSNPRKEPAPGQAVRIWRQETGSKLIPELNSQTYFKQAGWTWIGLYRDAYLVGIVTDREGAWAHVPIETVATYEPVVLDKLITAHGKEVLARGAV